jgi:hypothetical protein
MGMLKKYITALLIIILVFFYGYYFYMSNHEDKNFNEFLSQYDYFNGYEKLDDVPLTFKLFKDADEVGVLVIDNEVGYQSTITLATLIDLEGKIVNVRTFAEDETPSFYQRIEEEGFFEKAFKNKFIADGFRVGENVDAVSRATITSNAITKIVHKSSYYAGNKHLNIKVDNLYKGIRVGYMEISLFVLLLLVLFSYWTKNKRLRIVVLLYSVIIIGFKFSQFLSFSMFFAGIAGDWPSLYDDFRWYILVFGGIGLNLITGKNLYCAYMCPFGAVQELGFKYAKLDFFKVSPKLRKMLRFIPGVLAYCALVLALFTQQVGTLNYEPFSLLYGRLGTDIQWALLPLTLFASLFIMRFYCHYTCPVGYVLDLMLKVRRKIPVLWKRRI